MAFVAALRRLAVAGSLGAAATAAAAEPARASSHWQIVAPSAVRFEFTQMGARILGAFDDWQAEITFDSDRPDVCAVVFTIDLASVNTNSPERDAILRGPDFFDVERHPRAVFRSDTCRQRYLSAYEARGTVTLHGVEKEVVLPFRLEMQEVDGKPLAIAEGELAIDRLDFGIGTGQWSPSAIVGHTVRILVELYATGD